MVSVHSCRVRTPACTATAVWIDRKGVATFGAESSSRFWTQHARLTVARSRSARCPSRAPALFSNGAFGPILAFTLLMGASQGVITIVRGAVPLALFGAEGYGRILGLIATPILVVSALAPTVYALILDIWGSTVGVTILFISALLAMLAIELMGRWIAKTSRLLTADVVSRRARSRVITPPYQAVPLGTAKAGLTPAHPISPRATDRLGQRSSPFDPRLAPRGSSLRPELIQITSAACLERDTLAHDASAARNCGKRDRSPCVDVASWRRPSGRGFHAPRVWIDRDERKAFARRYFIRNSWGG